MHAPKDDPYHRERWRDPYPEPELAQLAELAAAAEARGVDFAWAVAPGLSMCYSDEADFEALAAKCDGLRTAGIRRFELLWDDIEHDLRCPGDDARYGAAASPSAAAHAQVSNRFRREIAGADPLVVCPTGYAGTGRTPYRDTLGAGLDEEAVVYWTGPEVVSQAISGADLAAAHDSFAHRLLLWDNYPVNDFAPDRLFLGPLRGRAPELADERLAGLVANGMLQAVPSKLPLTTVADFAADPHGYDPLASFEQALADVGAEVVGALRGMRGEPVSELTVPEDLTGLVEALAGGVDAATAVVLLEPFV